MAETKQRDIEAVLARRLFFIAATEKSGTTWMQMMLDAHPEVACRGEGQFVSKLLPLLGGALHEYTNFVEGLNERVFHETPGFPVFDGLDRLHLVRTAAALLLAKYGSDDGVVAIGEKTPGNIRALPALKALFPDAKIVFMVRDPRDVIVSGHVHLKRQHGAAGEEPIENYARRVAKVWAADMARANAFLSAHPADAVLVRYEALHAAPAAALGPVLTFLGVDDDAQTLERLINAGRFETLSGGRQRGQEDVASQFRKGVVGDGRDRLDAGVLAAIDDEAGAMLRQLGYADQRPAAENHA